jgi:UDP-glucose 4-epimerase
MSEKIKILVTGGTGYIGSHTIIELIRTGKYEAISVDNCSRSTEGTIDRIHEITGVRPIHYKVDICDREAFFAIFKDHPDIAGIIHFAAYKSVPESVEKPLSYYRNNLQSLENVLEACSRYGVPRLIFSSSCSIYGDVSQLPVTEDTPVGDPFCPYAHTKQIGEAMIRFYVAIHPEMRVVILRYFNPVGADKTGLNGELSPDKPNNLLPVITQVAIGKIPRLTVFGTDYDTRDGSCVRDYIHVSDIAVAHILSLEYLEKALSCSNFEIFNLGSGHGYTVLEMIEAFERLTGMALPHVLGARRPGDVPAIYSNSQKAKSLLGWDCHYTLDDMIRTAWLWEKHLSKK